MDLADAALVRVAEREHIRRVFTSTVEILKFTGPTGSVGSKSRLDLRLVGSGGLFSQPGIELPWLGNGAGERG